MKKLLMFLCVMFNIVGIAEAAGVPFDVIVPDRIEVRSDGINVGVGFSGWGWIGATTNTISLSDLQNVVLTGSVDDPSVAINDVFLNETQSAPLVPGEFAGPVNTIYQAFLQTGETLKTGTDTLWQVSINFPQGYSGSVTFSGTVALGDQHVSYTSEVVIGDFPHHNFISGQRLSSVPIPILSAVATPKTIEVEIPGSGCFNININNPSPYDVSMTPSVDWAQATPSGVSVSGGSVTVVAGQSKSVSVPCFNVGSGAQPGDYVLDIIWNGSDTGGNPIQVTTDPTLTLVYPGSSTGAVGGTVEPVDKLDLLFNFIFGSSD